MCKLQKKKKKKMRGQTLNILLNELWFLYILRFLFNSHCSWTEKVHNHKCFWRISDYNVHSGRQNLRHHCCWWLPQRKQNKGQQHWCLVSFVLPLWSFTFHTLQRYVALCTDCAMQFFFYRVQQVFYIPVLVEDATDNIWWKHWWWLRFW